MTAAAPRKRLAERHPPETAVEPSRRPEPANPVPTGDKIAATVWDDFTPEFPGLTNSKVDLVDELEQILRGDFADTGASAPAQEFDPLDPEVNAASLAGHFTPADRVPAAEPAPRPAPATAIVVEAQAVLPVAKGLPTASAVPPKPASALPVKAANFNLTAIEDPCEDQVTTALATTPSAFWKVGDRIPIEQPAPPRVRGGIRSDIVIILVLALLIAGGGAYSAFRDWGATAPEPAGTEVARADIGALGAVAGPNATPDAATPGDVVATAPAPLLGEMPLPGETPPAGLTAADPVLAEAPRVPQELPPGTRTVDTLTIPIGTQLANTGVPVATTPAPAQPRVPATNPVANDPVLAYAPTQPAAATPFDEAASLAAQPRQQAAIPPVNPNPAGGTVTATARTWVNMRAGPDNEAAVITVVAGGATVNVVACNGWCEVVYNGQTGWIYQDFLNGAPN